MPASTLAAKLTEPGESMRELFCTQSAGYLAALVCCLLVNGTASLLLLAPRVTQSDALLSRFAFHKGQTNFPVGAEAAGVVVALGPDVDSLKVCCC